MRTDGGFFVTPSPLLVTSGAVHAAAAAWAFADPSRWPLALGAVALNHVGIAAACVSPRSGLIGPNRTRVDGARDAVALTFDDGPDPDVTPRVLALLAAAGMRASFFCIGQRAERHPDVVRAIRAAGHGVENHTFHHHHGFAFSGPAALTAEIRRGQDAIGAVAGVPPRFFRAPAGMRNPWVPGAVAAVGLDYVSWTRRGYDAVSRDAARVAARLTRSLAAGDILLMHDGHAGPSSDGRPVVIETLTRVLDALAAAGLRSAPLHDLVPRV
ncbi:MAG: polysaccharide deacetylase family protein [Vicinamibacterales bacterium]